MILPDHRVFCSIVRFRSVHIFVLLLDFQQETCYDNDRHLADYSIKEIVT